MNPEIKSIVENMRRGKKESLNSTDILVYQFGQMANLLSFLADEAEKSTKKIVRLTWALFGLTVALLVVAIVQAVILK